MINDPYIALKWRINGLKSYFPSMQRPVWAGLYSVYGSTWGVPDFACKLPPSRESLIRSLAKVSAKSILYITNIEQLEILPNRCSWGEHECFTQPTVRYSRDASKLLLYSECFNLWSWLITLSAEMSNMTPAQSRVRSVAQVCFIFFFLRKPPNKPPRTIMRRRYTGYENTIASSIFKCISSRFLHEPSSSPKSLLTAISEIKHKDSCLHRGSRCSPL